MDCPVCKEPLIVVEYDHVEIDYCVACQGIWLDAGEIELLFGDADACRGVLTGGNPGAIKAEKPRRCPVCSVKMGKESTCGEAPVTYDVCPRGHGLWFDEGEMAQILRHADAFPCSEIARFLSGVFDSAAAEKEGA